jgi:hypothetical protein
MFHVEHSIVHPERGDFPAPLCRGRGWGDWRGGNLFGMHLNLAAPNHANARQVERLVSRVSTSNRVHPHEMRGSGTTNLPAYRKVLLYSRANSVLLSLTRSVGVTHASEFAFGILEDLSDH